MDVIQQTNRSILFEEINPEKKDLCTIIGDVDGMESLTDDKMKEINETLAVSNFEEFLEKFSPAVYSCFNVYSEKVIYTLKKPDGIPTNQYMQIPVTMENDFLKMLLSLMEENVAQGLAVDFKLEHILDMISPKKALEDIRYIRKEIQFTFGQYYILKEGHPKKKELYEKLQNMFQDASKNYYDVMAMIPLAMEDIRTRLIPDFQTKEYEEAFMEGLLSMEEGGELKILKAVRAENSQVNPVDDLVREALIKSFEANYRTVDGEYTQYICELVIRTFCPLVSLNESNMELESEIKLYNNYLEFYKKTKEDFIAVAKPLMEKILGVKVFFDQYKVKKGEMTPQLLITNNKLDSIVKIKNLARLDVFLKTANSKNNFNHTLWFGIVTNIALENRDTTKLNRIRFPGTEKEEKECNTLENVSILLRHLYPHRVILLFSFISGEDTTFSYIAEHGIGLYKEKCKPLLRQEFSEFAVPCMPNATIIPKEKSGLFIGQRMELKEDGKVALVKDKKEIIKLWMGGIYVGAAYEAAGLMAAWQCPAYLKEHFPNAREKLPGIRFDIEESWHKYQVTTTMSKEIWGYPKHIKNEIMEQKFGFLFSSDNGEFKGKEIKKIMVLNCRNLLAVNNLFEPVYKTMVITYIERFLRLYSNDFKQDGVVKFFSNHPDSPKNKWNAEREFINSILYAGDGLNCKIEDKLNFCNIEFIFHDGIRNMEIIMANKQ